MKRYTKIAAAAIGAGAAWGAYCAASRRARRQNLAGQVVFITGGSKGFGLALAREFAALGCKVALCARDAGELERARQLLGDGEVFTVVCDVLDKDAIQHAVESVTRRFGHIDILVNNAGEIMVSPLENLELADFERAMGVMFWGPVHMSMAVLPAMKARGHGRIVNITSIGGKVSVPHLLSYSCAKAAAVAFSNGLRIEVKQFGVDVTTIIPGLMRTGSQVNALFKGSRSAESAWFGTAASLPLLTLSAEQAARLSLNAICANKAEKILGAPAQLLAKTQVLFPGITAEILRLSNALLPSARDSGSPEPGRKLEHGFMYDLLTTLGQRAGRRLNQPV